MIAIIKTGGKQYLVKEQDLLKIEKLPVTSRKSGHTTFSEVLLVGTDTAIEIGAPTVSGAHVDAAIVSDGKAAKLNIVKFKSKVRYRRNRGHRQPFTEVRITKIAK